VGVIDVGVGVVVGASVVVEVGFVVGWVIFYSIVDAWGYLCSDLVLYWIQHYFSCLYLH
jgi:hypothetical protein